MLIKTLSKPNKRTSVNVCIDPLKLQTEDLRELTIVGITTAICILVLVWYLHLLLLTRQNISTFQMKAHLKIYIFSFINLFGHNE